MLPAPAARSPLRRPLRRLVCVAAVAACALLATPATRAERGDAKAIIDDPDELSGWIACEQGKWVRAREIGDKILARKPRSYAGHYILGVALHYGEGELARSVHHLEESVKEFERRWGRAPGDDAPVSWHGMALRQLAFSLDEMDRPADELKVLERYDKVYERPLIAQRVWPLMKLRRFAEARAEARLAIASGDEEQRIIAKTGLCATEFEAGDREAAYRACGDAARDFPAGSSGGQMEYSNASEAALSVFRFDEGERLLAESTKRVEIESWGNPFQSLAGLYLGEGRVGEAIEALKQGQELRMRRPAWLDQHGQARLDRTVAALLLVVGQTERARLIAERAEARPDRAGVWSGTEEQARCGVSLLVAATLRELAERDAEDALTAGFLDGLRLRARSLARRVEAWREARRGAVLLADEGFLLGTLRPYYVGGADLPIWLVPEVVDAVGPGVVLRTLAAARKRDASSAAPAYFDAIEAEAELARGEEEAALAAAERAVAQLPRAEALLMARAAAVGAEAARRLGRSARAAELYTIALTREPGVFRRLGLRLPVTVESDGSAVGRAAADLIDSSPRFRAGRGGHRVVLRGQVGGEACLLGPSDDVIGCANVNAPPGQPPKQAARELVAALHQAAFAIKVDLSQADLTSLDGSPTAARAERQVKSLLDTLGPTMSSP